MGNVAAVDMGLVILRCSIFDRKNLLFPMQIKKRVELREPGKKHTFYFSHNLSFYSPEHGGTFHFFQLNVLHSE